MGTPRVTFQQVANPYCRVVDNTSAGELCRYSLAEAGSESGLIVSKIGREAGGRWGFHALGLPCRGRTYKDSLPQLRAACSVKTSSLLLRTQSSGSNLGASTTPIQLQLPSPFEAAAAPVKDPKCCVVM